jgi:flotillin
METTLKMLAIIASLVVTALIIAGFLASRYKKVKAAGTALIVIGYKNIFASKVGAFVWPVIHSHKMVDVTDKKIVIVRRGVRKGDEKHGDRAYEGIHCKDNIRADLEVAFYIGLDDNLNNIVNLANKLGVDKIGNQNLLEEHFTDKFSEGLKTTVKQFDYEDLHTSRQIFRDKLKESLKDDLSGYRLLDVVIDKIDQTALEAHDAGNVLDVRGIRKINQITAEENIATNKIVEEERSKKKKDTVAAEQIRLTLDKDLQEAQSKQKREIATVVATEESLTKVKQEEERRKGAVAEIKANEGIEIENENKNREVSVTQINNRRVVEIEGEKVKRATETERVKTEREVAVSQQEMEVEVEGKKKDVADTKSERVRIERQITTEEEATRTVQVQADADREKYVVVTASEAKSLSDKIAIVAAAEAQNDASVLKAKETVVLAEASLTSDKLIAQGTIARAEATRKELAAPGLAEAEVVDAMADAQEKTGVAEANVQTKKADAIRAEGSALADSEAEMGKAKAVGDSEKYKAMDSISPEVRAHELQKLHIEKDLSVEIAQINADKDVGVSGAVAMGEGMKGADLQIIGDTGMLTEIKNSISTAKAVDAKFDNSEILSLLVEQYRGKEANLTDDIKTILTTQDGAGNAIKNTMLAKLISSNGLGDLLKIIQK